MSFKATYESIAQLGLEMLIQTPFWATLFLQLNRRADGDYPAAVQLLWEDGAPAIGISPALWADLDETRQLIALQHELIHLIFGHPAQKPLYASGFLFDVAADLVVAAYLPESNNDALDLAFPSPDLDGFYQALDLAWEQGDPKLHQLHAQREQYFASHQTWRTFKDPENLKAYRKKSVAAIYRQDGPGLFETLPEALTIQLQSLLPEIQPQLDWRRLLHFFANSARKTRLTATTRRPSKRYGTTPGYRVRAKARLLIALDTSASISEVELQRFFAEVRQLWRQGLDLEIVECDQLIRRQYPYAGHSPEGISGRGGTAFYPVFRYAAERGHFDGIIYFTDGKGAHPGKVLKLPLLWVLSPGGIAPEALQELQFPGRFIQMNN